MKVFKSNFLALAAFLLAIPMFAHKGPTNGDKPKDGFYTSTRSNCQPARAQIDQNINNVRARLSTGGDVWWDLQQGLYIVPNPAPGQPAVSALFAGGVWVGGVNRVGAYKLAGVTYRSNTNNFDWYPGPLNATGSTEAAICRDWDRFFVVQGEEIKRHNALWEAVNASGGQFEPDSIPENVKYWPGRGNPYWSEKYEFALPDQPLGAFWDENLDGVYDPADGDFPNIEIRGCFPETRTKAKELIPDQMHFWIYNDNGGTHRLTGGAAIQMEVQVQAFAYATNDEINDMTFQRYKLINKANEDLIDCYFAMWVDPDLGCYTDDFIGCDTVRSLAYTYNEDALDGQNGCACPGGVNTYCDKVGAIGTDYFRGPRGPKVFRKNANGEVIIRPDGTKILDDPEPGTGERDTLVELGMTSFIYMNNCGVGAPEPATCDPSGVDEQYYNNLRGFWRDGTPLTEGGTGFNPGSTEVTKYAFPDAPDRQNGWSMCTSSLGFGDRRTLQATGPLLLQPGAVEELIVGVVWVPELDYPCPDISRLQFADDIAQSLFDNCFDITDGPRAPDVCGVELDRELILVLTNDTLASNNAFEQYSEIDLQAPNVPGVDNLYRFEGYKVYQLANAGVSTQELNDITKARLIFQSDVKNGVSEIFNWNSAPNPFGAELEPVWSFQRMVQGADRGTRRTYQILEDQFALDDRKLVNHRQYHYLVLAYAYNNFSDFDPKTGVGQRRAYLEGRENVKVYSFTPRPIVYGRQNAEFGDGAIITRLSGQGNGVNFLDISDELRESIVRGTFDGRITYQENAAPINVRVFNPLEVLDGKYRLEIKGTWRSANNQCRLDPGATWVLTDLNSGDVVASESTLDRINEQIIYKKGFTVDIAQNAEPGADVSANSGGVGQTLTYRNPNGANWLVAVPDGGGPFDIGGRVMDPVSTATFDRQNQLSRLGTGIFFPFMTARFEPANVAQGENATYLSPAWREQDGHGFLVASAGNTRLADLNNIDIVFTPNKDLWSRCIVVETASPEYYNSGISTVGNSRMLEVREQASVDKNGNPDGDGVGMGWFPGYAVDVETGKRVNIFFGENSTFNQNEAQFINGNRPIGADMVFNPNGQLLLEGEGLPSPAQNLRRLLLAGGQHMIYVTRQQYDGCEQLRNRLRRGAPNNATKFNALSVITWTSLVLGSAVNQLLPVSEGLIPNEAIVKLRVTNPYGKERLITNSDVIRNCTTEEPLPSYEIEFRGKQLQPLTADDYEGPLADVNVVPNPYYAYSAYETNQFTNTIKITNLPEQATITIYNIEGNFIRQFRRDERPIVKGGNNSANRLSQINPNIEWDMKNTQGIPVASGVYLIHVSAPGLGERTLKWFGINRKFDPTGL